MLILVCWFRFAFLEGVTNGGEVGNDHAQFPSSSSSLLKQEPAADGTPEVIEGGQLQLQLLDPDKSEQQPLGLDSSFQEYIR